MLIKKENPNYNPDLRTSKENTRYIEITDCLRINEEFHKAFQKIFAKNDVDDNYEVLNFLDSGNDTLSSEYLSNRSITEKEKNNIKWETTLDEMQYALFTKMKGSSAPGIDGFTVSWL